MAVPIGRAVAVAHDDAVPAAVAFYSSRDAAKMRSQVASAQAALAAMRNIREAVSPVVVASATPAKALRFSGARRSSRAASPPASGLRRRGGDLEGARLRPPLLGRRRAAPPSPVPLVLSPALAASPAPSFGEASDAAANSDHYFPEEGLDRAHGDVDDDGFSEELNDYESVDVDDFGAGSDYESSDLDDPADDEDRVFHFTLPPAAVLDDSEVELMDDAEDARGLDARDARRDGGDAADASYEAACFSDAVDAPAALVAYYADSEEREDAPAFLAPPPAATRAYDAYDLDAVRDAPGLLPRP
ncbi:hypothetical protein JL721_6821 [Aureococcus anophagefferens]|nr:hypothetical protein JL721_6821 [Aureococcus anophagefferens]